MTAKVRVRTVAVVVLVAASITAVQGQRIWGGYYGETPPRFPTATTFEGSFHSCRILFSSNRREKRGWSTDWPGADLNFSTRLSELTKVRVATTFDGEERVPDAVVVRLTDDALFQCPFTLMEDAGTIDLSDEEVGRLRTYLLKGGFLFVSDYHGTRSKAQFDAEIRRVLPPGQFPIIDLTPPGHPLWNTMYPVTRVPQFASINTWRRGGGTIERWNDDGGPATARGIADAHGRLMVVMIHDSDIPDAWEREGEDPEYFYSFSPEAYAVGIDIVLYALTH